jgi:outer membrane protein OmpA-like peptidoglycan-associated protein
MSLSPILHATPAFEAEPPLWPGGVPGKSTLTSRLAPRTVILRVANPEGARPAGSGPGARDANGVAADADAAVERAATTSGQALPGAIQRRFEASLGTDLSSVRIHTGPESAAAAGAVGARAYATGQDIHFAAGAYQPDDPFGMHLLAHEVAHTVQQAGGPATRQHKLEVSAPGDRAEVEADRAADAMVAGAPASVGSAAGMQRNFDDAFESWDGGGAEGQSGGSPTSAGGPGYQLASNANERGPIKATIYFPTDGDTLSPDDHAAIDKVAARYGAEIDGGNYRIEVVGYADQRAEHGYNLDLANRRGDGVCHELGTRLRNGLPADTFCEAVGEVPSGNSADALAHNRRVEIRLFPSEAPPPYPMPPLDPPPKAPGWKAPPDWGTEWELYVDIAASGGGKVIGVEIAQLRFRNVRTGEEGLFDYAGISLGVSALPAGMGFVGGPYPFKTTVPVPLRVFASHDNTHVQAGVSQGVSYSSDYWILTGPRAAGADVVYLDCSGFGISTPNLGGGASMGPIRMR